MLIAFPCIPASVGMTKREAVMAEKGGNVSYKTRSIIYKLSKSSGSIEHVFDSPNSHR